MKKALKLAIVFCVTVIVLLMAVSCNQFSPVSGVSNQTTPDATTPNETTPEQTTPEQTTPEQTTPEQTTPEQTTPQTPEVHEHTWTEWTITKEATCTENGTKERSCTACDFDEVDTIMATGAHTWSEWATIKEPNCEEDGVQQHSCTVCDATEEAPIDDLDGHHVWGDWQLANDIPCGEEGSQSERVCQTCGAKETHDNERACYVWIHHTTLELGTCIQPGKVSEECQYCGKVQIRELQMAVHKWSEYVEVEPATCTQHGRKVKTCAVCGGTSDAQIYKLDHLYENGICTSCGHVEGSVTPTPIFEKESVYDNDGDGVNDTYLFSPVFPEKFENGDIIYINSGKYEQDLSSSIVGYRPYSGETQNSYWYCEEGKGQYIVYKITVAEAGVYEMAIRIRLHDTTERATKYTVNEGTEYEYSFETSYQFATSLEVYEAHNNDYDQSCYMYGMRFNLVEGDNYIKLEQSSLISKPIYSRDYYFVKVEEALPHEHEIVDGKCECGFIPVFENASVYDNDGDGKNDVYLFTPIIPEKFTSEDVVHVWAGDYDKNLSSSYVSCAQFNTPHWYCGEGYDEFIVYKVTVAEAGIYEMAIHTRLKDTKERGAKYTVNEGTANEYSFETSFQFATDEDVYAAFENEYTMSSFMYGIYLNLEAGDNYIKIEESSKSPKSQHFRDFFFVKVEQ